MEKLFLGNDSIQNRRVSQSSGIISVDGDDGDAHVYCFITLSYNVLYFWQTTSKV